MRTISFTLRAVLGIFIACGQLLIASDNHIPHSHSHTTSVCRGYAVGLAFNRSWDSGTCQTQNMNISAVADNYFNKVGGSDLAGNQAGDIILWGNKYGQSHAAYILTPGTSYGNIIVTEVASTGADKTDSINLTDVISRVGSNPWGYARFKKQWSIKAQNDFEDGDVKVHNSTGESPLTVGNLKWGSEYDLEAVEDGEVVGNYKRIFQTWRKGNMYGPVYSSHADTTVDLEPASGVYQELYTARFHKEYNVTFQNYFIGIGNAGIIKVKDVQYTAPETDEVEETYSINAEAVNQTLNSIIYTFDRWKKGSTTVSTSKNYDFYPTDHTTYTAHFVGKPTQVQGISCTTPPGELIHIT
ncbi:MAG: hypothetical protein JSW54_06240 [Fidelibacterota bacterium]|nr:MAG: hypothetical protein JSW54_06240 [Candidatus Neomarinimicrobiota bacterium]